RIGSCLGIPIESSMMKDTSEIRQIVREAAIPTSDPSWETSDFMKKMSSISYCSEMCTNVFKDVGELQHRMDSFEEILILLGVISVDSSEQTQKKKEGAKRDEAENPEKLTSSSEKDDITSKETPISHHKHADKPHKSHLSFSISNNPVFSFVKKDELEYQVKSLRTVSENLAKQLDNVMDYVKTKSNGQDELLQRIKRHIASIERIIGVGEIKGIPKTPKTLGPKPSKESETFDDFDDKSRLFADSLTLSNLQPSTIIEKDETEEHPTHESEQDLPRVTSSVSSLHSFPTVGIRPKIEEKGKTKRPSFFSRFSNYEAQLHECVSMLSSLQVGMDEMKYQFDETEKIFHEKYTETEEWQVRALKCLDDSCDKQRTLEGDIADALESLKKEIKHHVMDESGKIWDKIDSMSQQFSEQSTKVTSKLLPLEDLPRLLKEAKKSSQLWTQDQISKLIDEDIPLRFDKLISQMKKQLDIKKDVKISTGSPKSWNPGELSRRLSVDDE
ncbi:hypothetical protein ADUPG1_013291, partial [Aduncisulcus paluster]